MNTSLLQSCRSDAIIHELPNVPLHLGTASPSHSIDDTTFTLERGQYHLALISNLLIHERTTASRILMIHVDPSFIPVTPSCRAIN